MDSDPESIASNEESVGAGPEQSMASDCEKGLVGWENQDDPLNPLYKLF
jgi:hypothetical protein